MAEFLMPHLGADMTEGKLLGWRKKPGDHVSRGDIIADVETDKADIEVEVFTTGIVEKFLVEPGTSVPVGTPLAIIRTDGEAPSVPVRREAPPTQIPSAAPTPAVPAAKPVLVVPPPSPHRIHISPVAKKLAAELGVDVATVTPMGPGGRITREDIERAAKARPAAVPATPATPVPPAAAPAPAVIAPPAPLDKQARMRQTIAAAMARSKREIPHYYLSTTIDLKHLLDWLTEENQKRPVEDRLLYGVLLIKAVALTLREFPELNAVWEAGQLMVKPEIHVGVAISIRQGGLIAPALHQVDKKSLIELMRDFRDLIQRARAGSLRSSELSESTITVTSLGEQGVETVFGIIYPPQVALVGFGKVVQRPWVVDGQALAVRPVITATLSADHRVSDGHRGGLFLSSLERRLQQPEKL
ncbi:MAG: 2-oxo acid dehydrogenase subunit E2 [Acidobacteriia bacterium]|nr:2-oxo acid dehydrogenase subunit E2 [Terriglobia bacterium]